MEPVYSAPPGSDDISLKAFISVKDSFVSPVSVDIPFAAPSEPFCFESASSSICSDPSTTVSGRGPTTFTGQ
jgi:hypothetical protein